MVIKWNFFVLFMQLIVCRIKNTWRVFREFKSGRSKNIPSYFFDENLVACTNMADMRYMIHSTSFSQTSLELVIFFKSILTEAGCTPFEKKKIISQIFPYDSSWHLVFLFFITHFYTYFTKSYIYIYIKICLIA